MASKSKQDIIAEFNNSETGKKRALTRKGAWLYGGKGERWSFGMDRTYCKAGATVSELTSILAGKGYDRGLCRVDGGFIPNPTAVSEKRQRDAKKKEEQFQAKLVATKATEAQFVPADPQGELAPSTELIQYLATCCKKHDRPRDNRLEYIYDMARFHGGDTGGYLGTAIMASMVLPDGYQHTKALDLIADMVAQMAFGSHMVAARLWNHAITGR